MANYFLTFGDGEKRFFDAARRLTRQAIASGHFNKCFNLNLDAISANDFRMHLPYILNTPNLGYWLWKPFAVRHVLNKLKVGDILFYCDAGCELSIRANRHFTHLLSIVNDNGSLFFELPHLESHFTKKSFLQNPEINGELCSNTNQVHATYFFLRVSSMTKKLVNDWIRLSIQDNYKNIAPDDTLPDVSKRHVQHKNDQSILSCLVKSYALYIEKETYVFPKFFYYQGGPTLMFFCHQLRNISEFSLLDNSPILPSRKKLFRDLLFIMYSLRRVMTRPACRMYLYWALRPAKALI